MEDQVNENANQPLELTPSQQIRADTLWRRKCEIRFFMLLMCSILAVAAYFLSFTWVKVMASNDHLGTVAISVETLVIVSSVVMSLVRLMKQQSYWIAQYHLSNRLEVLSNDLTARAGQINAMDPTKFLTLPSIIYEAPSRSGSSAYDFRDIEGGTGESVREEEKDDDKPQCMVCLEEFAQGDVLTFLPCVCAHRYHRACLLTWLQRHNTCPLCNESVSDSPAVAPVMPPITGASSLTSRTSQRNPNLPSTSLAPMSTIITDSVSASSSSPRLRPSSHPSTLPPTNLNHPTHHTPDYLFAVRTSPGERSSL